ncbi:lipase secretion chaperone [Alkalimarinus sediminis]|uniref:Lipase chaperone n=1 Tax=Alkalimarinus sediminis TaxID=1632866 RepID=A0A9E8KNY2_9ALTE|nr:lipase secretion chaperone [Alkalimarinus sediminis]UZW73640.1 hypothetical protein NNL22_11385 [Alkalimarinus sediminis]
MNKKYKISIIFGLFMAVIGLGLVYKTQDPDSPFINAATPNSTIKKPVLPTTTKTLAANPDATPTSNDQPADVEGEIPVVNTIRSLKGTQIHGDLRVDENGHLIVEESVKNLFDYFLNASGEVPRKVLIEQIKQGIASYLAEPAQSEALALFSSYLEYQDALQAEINNGLYQVSPGNLDDLEATYQARSQLRSFHLGNEAASAFFAEEEARDNFTVGKLRLNANTNLTEEERQAELNALESTLPDSHKQVLYKQRNREAIRSKINDLRKENADIYTLQEEWSKHYDSETVERFVKLEATRNDWNNRYQAYREKKQHLATLYSSEDSYQQALEQLKSSMFSGNELLRVNAKDRIALN